MIVLAAIVIFVVSLAVIVKLVWSLRRRASPRLPDDVVRPPPPHGFENLSGAEYELIEWELHVETHPQAPEPPPGVAPPPD